MKILKINVSLYNKKSCSDLAQQMQSNRWQGCKPTVVSSGFCQAAVISTAVVNGLVL